MSLATPAIARPWAAGFPMKPSHDARARSINARTVRCLQCRHPIPRAESARFRGLCRICVEESAVAGWRLVYDREKGVGAIPSNLRAAYGL
jgi:hypothetical protein